MEPTIIGALITAVATIIGSIIAVFIAYGVGKNKTKREIFNADNKSPGIEKVFPNFDCQEFSSLMSRPGKKVIVNTWLYGLDIIGIRLKEALKAEETSIEFVILESGSVFASIRSKELNLDVDKTIEANKDLLISFLRTLSKSQRTRVKIYTYDNYPKITIYADGDEAFVSFFWPDTHALTGPQLLIKGKDGYFSEHIWKYYESLNKKDVTKDFYAQVSEVN